MGTLCAEGGRLQSWITENEGETHFTLIFRNSWTAHFTSIRMNSTSAAAAGLRISENEGKTGFHLHFQKIVKTLKNRLFWWTKKCVLMVYFCFPAWNSHWQVRFAKKTHSIWSICYDVSSRAPLIGRLPPTLTSIRIISSHKRIFDFFDNRDKCPKPGFLHLWNI